MFLNKLIKFILVLLAGTWFLGALFVGFKGITFLAIMGIVYVCKTYPWTVFLSVLGLLLLHGVLTLRYERRLTDSEAKRSETRVQRFGPMA